MILIEVIIDFLSNPFRTIYYLFNFESIAKNENFGDKFSEK